MTPAELLADPWAFGPWCWMVGEVRLLPEPIYVRGMQGLWPLPEEHRTSLSAHCPMGVYVQSALTLLQPYASAIAAGVKKVENRPWRRSLPPNTWVGLHAGKTLYAPENEDATAYTSALLQRWRETGQWTQAPALENLPRGLLLGAMRIRSIERYPDNGPLFGGAS